MEVKKPADEELAAISVVRKAIDCWESAAREYEDGVSRYTLYNATDALEKVIDGFDKTMEGLQDFKDIGRLS